MFASLAAQETFVADVNLASWTQGNVLNQVKNISCFPDANFASETNVSQFCIYAELLSLTLQVVPN